MSLINKAHVRRRILETAKSTRYQKFDRVSEETYEWLNRRVDDLIVNLLQCQPSKGQTIYPPTRSDP